MVDDLVHLRRKLGVQLGDHRVDRVEDVVGDEAVIRQRLAHQSRDGIINFFGRGVAARFEVLFEDRRKLVEFGQCPCATTGAPFQFSCHILCPDVSVGFPSGPCGPGA